MKLSEIIFVKEIPLKGQGCFLGYQWLEAKVDERSSNGTGSHDDGRVSHISLAKMMSRFRFWFGRGKGIGAMWKQEYCDMSSFMLTLALLITVDRKGRRIINIQMLSSRTSKLVEFSRWNSCTRAGSKKWKVHRVWVNIKTRRPFPHKLEGISKGFQNKQFAAENWGPSYSQLQTCHC